MGIKDKPMSFATDELEKFRSHDPESAQDTKSEIIQDTSGMDARVTKTVRMRHRFSLLLKEEAHKRTMQSGTKVSEADLLDEALSDWQLKLQTGKG